MKFEKVIELINSDLRANVDSEYRLRVRDQYQMNVDNFWGVRTPIIRKIANNYFSEIKELDFEQKRENCNILLQTGIYEHKIIAFHWMAKLKKDFKPEYFSYFQEWLKQYVDDWIDCDDFSIHVMGQLLLKFPDLSLKLGKWTRSANRWIRRSALVSLIPLARKGESINQIKLICQSLLKDKDPLVMKAYGWLLSEASKKRPIDVYHFLKSHINQIPSSILRKASQKLDENLRDDLMGIQ